MQAHLLHSPSSSKSGLCALFLSPGGDERLAGGCGRFRGRARGDRPLGTDTTHYVLYRRGQPQARGGGAQGQRAPEVTSQPLGLTHIPAPSLRTVGTKTLSLPQGRGAPGSTATADAPRWALERRGLLHSRKWWGDCCPYSHISAPSCSPPHPRCWGSIIFMQ